MFTAIKTYFLDVITLYFAWMPSYMAITFIFLFGLAFVFVFIKIIITVLKMIPFL